MTLTPETKLAHESLNRSPRHNWVEDAGQLPAYIQHIANDLEQERGIPLSRAIPIAIGTVKRWARGGGNVTAETRAKAQAAVAEWEALKAKNRARQIAKSIELDLDFKVRHVATEAGVQRFDKPIGSPISGSGGPWRDTTMSIDDLLKLQMPNRLDPKSPGIQALAEDIRKNGLRNPIQVEDSPRGMFIGDGHHRLLAAREAGMDKVPVRIFDPTPEGLTAARRALLAAERAKEEGKGAGLDLDFKVVRHVRTDAGVRRFKQPKGSIIVRDGSPALPGLTSVRSDYPGLEKVLGHDGKHYYVGQPDDGKGYVVWDEHDNAIIEADTEEQAYSALSKKMPKQKVTVRRLTAKERAAGKKPAKPASSVPAPPKEKSNIKKVRSDSEGFLKFQGDDGNTYYIDDQQYEGSYAVYDPKDKVLAEGATLADAQAELQKIVQKNVTKQEIDKRRGAAASDSGASKPAQVATAEPGKDGKTAYRVTDPSGKVHEQRSSRKFTHVLIRRNKGSDNYFVSWASSKDNAEREARVKANSRDHVSVVPVLSSSQPNASKEPAPSKTPNTGDFELPRNFDLTSLSDTELNTVLNRANGRIVGSDTIKRVDAERARRNRLAEDAAAQAQSNADNAGMRRQLGDTSYDTSKMTAAMKGRLEKHLNERVRFGSEVLTRRELYTRGASVELLDDGKQTAWMNIPSEGRPNSGVRIPKMVYDTWKRKGGPDKKDRTTPVFGMFENDITDEQGKYRVGDKVVVLPGGGGVPNGSYVVAGYARNNNLRLRDTQSNTTVDRPVDEVHKDETQFDPYRQTAALPMKTDKQRDLVYELVDAMNDGDKKKFDRLMKRLMNAIAIDGAHASALDKLKAMRKDMEDGGGAALKGVKPGDYRTVTDAQMTKAYDDLQKYIEDTDAKKGRNADDLLSDTVFHYTSTDLSDEINGYLRHTTRTRPDEVQFYKQQTANLDALVKHTPVPVDMKAYRIATKGALPGNLQVGTTVTDRGFMSVTLDRNVLKTFAKSREGYDIKHDKVDIIEIDVPAGTKGAYLGATSYGKRLKEQELLLARGTKLRVTSITTDANGTRHISAEVVR